MHHRCWLKLHAVLEIGKPVIRHRLAKALAIAAISSTALLALAACSSGSASAASKANPYHLISPGRISVASSSNLSPYAFTDSNGNFTGFDIQLFTDVAHHIGIKQVAVSSMDFSAILPSIVNHQYDVGVAAIGITPARKQTVAFSNGYLVGYLTVITSKSSGITKASAESLAGKRLGVVQGTIQETYAEQHFPKATLVRFPDNNSALAALNSGTIDGDFLDYQTAKLYMKQYGVIDALNVPSFNAPAGFAVAKGNKALVDALNKGLKAEMKNGTWETLYKKWFPGTPIPSMYTPSGSAAS